MKVSNLLIILLSLIALCVLSNGQMMGKKCSLPPIPPTLDNGSQNVFLVAQLLQNEQVINSYNNTFSKGQSASFFGDSNNVMVYNSGEYLHVEYKSVSGSSGYFYYEYCTGNDTIPNSSSTIKEYNGGFVVMGSTYKYKYRLALKTI